MKRSGNPSLDEPAGAPDSLLKGADGAPSGTRILVATAVLAFTTSLIVLLSLVSIGYVDVAVGAAIVTAVIIAAATAPLLYLLLVAPLVRELTALLTTRARTTAAPVSAPLNVDTQTRLANRRGITTSLLETKAHAERYGNPLSVALVELDEFDKLTKDFGAKAGQRAIEVIAEVFTDTLRMPDKAGRYDGEEFLIVLPQTTLKDAGKITERIRAAVAERELKVAGKKVDLTVSIGVTQFRKGEDLEQLVTRASEAKLEAHSAGRNRVVSKRAGK